jgi:hypothetical protein
MTMEKSLAMPRSVPMPDSHISRTYIVLTYTVQIYRLFPGSWTQSQALRVKVAAPNRAGTMGGRARPWICRLVSWRASTRVDGLPFRRHLPLPPSL